MSEIIVANALPVNVSRRRFMQAILAIGVAPAIVSAVNIMPVRQIILATEEDARRVISMTQPGKVWTTNEILAFYNSRLHVKDPERYDIMQRDIQRAMMEGRIKQSGHNNYYNQRWGYTKPDYMADENSKEEE